MDPARKDRLTQSLSMLIHRFSHTKASSFSRQRLLASARLALVPGAALVSLLALWRIMSYWSELVSWLYCPRPELYPIRKPGDRAPSTETLVLPCHDEKPAVILFLRHCGCPFAEKAFLETRKAADEYSDVHFITVSHSSHDSTKEWLDAIGGPGKIGIIVDAEHTLYGRWGLGVSGWTHIFTWDVFSNLFKLAKEEGIKNRPTSSGSRWQTGGHFAVDGNGVIKYGGPSVRADDIADVEAAIRSVKSSLN